MRIGSLDLRLLAVFLLFCLPMVSWAGVSYSGTCYSSINDAMAALVANYPQVSNTTTPPTTFYAMNATISGTVINYQMVTEKGGVWSSYNQVLNTFTCTAPKNAQTFPLDQVLTVLGCMVLFALGFIAGRGGK